VAIKPDYRNTFNAVPRVRVQSGFYRLDFQGAIPNVFDSVAVEDTISNAINCAGYARAMCAIEFSAANVTAKFRVILLDWNDTLGVCWSWKEFSLNTGNQTDIREAGYYHGEYIGFDIRAADRFKIIVTDITNSGSVSMWASVI
jgi:hypothetical protein